MNQHIIFFPFTHMSKRDQKTLQAFFEAFHFFCLDDVNSQDAKRAENELVQAAVPHLCDKKVQDRINIVFRQVMEWVKIHKGNERNLKLLFMDNPYFRDDTQVTAIKTQIKGAKKTSTTDGKNDMDRHLLFLRIAQMCDALNEDIDHELDSLEATKENLISTLRGLDGAVLKSAEGQIRPDQGEIMTGRRIASWAAGMSKAGGIPKDRPVLFVTTSPSIFNYLEANCESCVNALDIDEIKVHENDCENKKEWQRYLLKTIDHAVRNPGSTDMPLPETNDRCRQPGQIRVKIFTENEINRQMDSSENQIVVCLVELK